MIDTLTIQNMESTRLPTEVGEFQLYIYANNQDHHEHLALVMGDVSEQNNVLVRVHSECYTGDVLGSKRCDCGQQLHRAMELIAEAGSGIIIYLRQEGRGIGLLEKLRAYNLQDLGYDTVEANLMLGHMADERDYTVAARILEDLKINSIRLLTNNPQKINSLTEKGVVVTARLPLYGEITDENVKYVQTKIERLSHFPPQNTPSVASSSLIMKQVCDRLAQASEFCQERSRPYVTLSYAQTMDGSIAVKSGHRLNISNDKSHTLTHQLRTSHQAILVGIDTVLSDDPQLNVRLVAGQDPQPIILDSQLRCPVEVNLLQNGHRPLWIMTSQDADRNRQAELEFRGAKVFRLGTDNDQRVSLDQVLKLLAKTGIQSLMVEGGGQVITSFVKTQLVDQVVLTVAPMFVGGLHAVNCLGLTDTDDIPRLENLHYQSLDSDLIIRADLSWATR